MDEGGPHLGFALKYGEVVGIGCERGCEHFDGDLAIELRVAAVKHHHSLVTVNAQLFPQGLQ